MTLQQVHNKFKIFTGLVAADKGIGPLGEQIAAFVAEAQVAAKSIGVEYLESARKLVITLGYREGEPSYPVKITTAPLGKIGELEAEDTARLEASMGAAASKIESIICHELYITEDGDLLMVFMSHAS